VGIFIGYSAATNAAAQNRLRLTEDLAMLAEILL